MTIPWIEKYRPRKIDDLILDELSMKKVKTIIENKEMPNIIISGTPGIGKTTTIKCIARHLFGQHMNEAVLEINASDDRGIKAVQENIMNFCKKKLCFNDNYAEEDDDKQYNKKSKKNIKEEKKENKYSEHKIIILDEADNMTDKAQNLIINLMDKYKDQNITRFAFTCNNFSDIIEGIQSRCVIMRYVRLSEQQIIERLKYICDKENVKYTNDALNIIADISQGDVRTAINNLQLVYNANGSVKTNIYEICDKPQPKYIEKILKACIDKNFLKGIKIVRKLKNMGFIESDIISNILHFLIKKNCKFNDNIIPENIKHIIFEKISTASFIISNGHDTLLQLTGCIADIILSLENI